MQKKQDQDEMKKNCKDYDINSIIEMAWCDKTSFDSIQLQTNLSEKEVIKLMRSNLKKTSFDSIKLQTNLSEKEVIKIMRSNLKKTSFQVWRERVYGRKAKHAKI